MSWLNKLLGEQSKTKGRAMSKTAVETKVKPHVKQRTTEAPPPDAFVKAKRCLETIGENWYIFDRLVAEIYDTESYRDKYEKFDDCAKAEWGMQYRTAMNHVQVGQTIAKYGLTKDQLASFGIGWTNFMEISSTFKPEMTKAQVESRIKKAAKMSHDEVVRFKQEIKVGIEGGHPVTIGTIIFKLKNEALKVVQEGLATAKELLDVPYDDAALEYIIIDWLQMHDPDKVDEIKAQLKSDIGDEEEAPKPKTERKERADKGKVKATKAKGAKKSASAEEDAGSEEDDDDLLGD